MLYVIKKFIFLSNAYVDVARYVLLAVPDTVY